MYAYIGAWTSSARSGTADGITVCRVSAQTGKFDVIETIAAPENPSYLYACAARRTLYAAHGDGREISSYRMSRDSGRLSPLNSSDIAGFNPVHLTIDPSGQVLLVSDYGSGAIEVLPIDTDGSLLPGIHRLELSGRGGAGPRPSHPHQCAFDPLGACFLVPDKGQDCIFTCRIVDGLNVKVCHRFEASAGSGPRHAVFDKTGAYAYAVNELHSTVSVFQYDHATGELRELQKLSTLPPDCAEPNLAAAIFLDSSERHVVVTNRGHDSLVAYRRDPASGRLGLCAWTPARGRYPRFALCMDGKNRIYVANEATHSVELFTSSATGLEHVTRALDTRSPVSVALW